MTAKMTNMESSEIIIEIVRRYNESIAREESTSLRCDVSIFQNNIYLDGKNNIISRNQLFDEPGIDNELATSIWGWLHVDHE